eukprot:s2624_g2.t2
MDVLQIRAEIAQAKRRRDAALQRAAELEREMQRTEVWKPLAEVPLISAAGLVQRSALKLQDSSLPCELWPFVYSSIARAAVPEAVLFRLRQQLDSQKPDRCSVIASPDHDFQACLLELCRILGAALCGHQDFSLELDQVCGVTQQQGDYSPPAAYRNQKSRDGFSCIMDLDLPPSLSCENHERPTKGSYGFHDGLHNLLWKGDRTTDKDDLVQPGIIQLELRVGQLYVFPDFVQTLTYPFNGEGKRRWIKATMSLDLLDLEDARDPPSPSSFHEDDARRFASRSWSKCEGSSPPRRSQRSRAEPKSNHVWLEVADEPSIDWLRDFLAKLSSSTVGWKVCCLARSDSAASRRVMDFILPEESKLCKDFMQRFLLRLDERRSAEHRQPTTKAATARQVARARSVPVKDARDGQRASRATEQGMRARSTAREESPEVVAAVARARRRASEEKRRQAKAEEATAKALQKERYGKRDERLARFSEDTKACLGLFQSW